MTSPPTPFLLTNKYLPPLPPPHLPHHTLTLSTLISPFQTSRHPSPPHPLHMLMCFSPSPLPLDFDPHFSHIYYPSHFTLPPCLQRTLSLLILHISPFISTTPLSLYPRSPSRFYTQTTSSRLKQRGPPTQGKFPLNFPLLLGIKTEFLHCLIG